MPWALGFMSMNSASKHLDHVYAAIADPTRRAILSLLLTGDATVGTLADRFPISFNGVSKHVKVLERAGLVRRRITGREHWVTPSHAPGPGVAMARALPQFWDRRLAALERMLVEEDAADPPGKRRKRARR